MPYDTPESILALGTPAAELADALKTLPSPEVLESLTLEQKRAGMEDRSRARYEASSTPGTTESIHTIPLRDGTESEIRVFTPVSGTAAGKGGRPLVALIFGGGFIAGSNVQLVPFARVISSVYDAVTVTLSYRLAPEWKFPTAAEDVWDSVRWLSENAERMFGADLSAGFVLGGVSAGGNLTAVSAQRALKEPLAKPLTGLWACIPVAVSTATVPAGYEQLFLSREQNADAPLLSGKDIKTVQALYVPDETSENYTPFAPTASSDFHKLPRTYVQVAGLDPLRDDGLIYESVLRNAGVDTRLDVYAGVPHAHFSALPGMESSERARRDVVRGVGWLLGRNVGERVLEGLEGRMRPAASTPRAVE